MRGLVIDLPDVEATWAVGAVLGRLAKEGDVFWAEGDLGAGKTSLAQGVARGLQVPPEHYVNSPSFAILQTHPGRMPFHHIDLYRLGDPDELLGLGLEELVGVEGLAFVEWPSRAPELLPADHLHIVLTIHGEGRRLALSARGPRGQRLIEAFKDERTGQPEANAS